MLLGASELTKYMYSKLPDCYGALSIVPCQSGAEVGLCCVRSTALSQHPNHLFSLVFNTPITCFLYDCNGVCALFVLLKITTSYLSAHISRVVLTTVIR